jgi:hypothetical protein
MKTPKRAPSTAASQSASVKKMLGDLPPSSRVTRLSVSAAFLTMIFPTAALPVNAILSTLGCATSAAPVVSPNPLMMLTTPGGRPTSENQLANSRAVSGVCSAGFSTQVQPAASAGASFHAAMSSG